MDIISPMELFLELQMSNSELEDKIFSLFKDFMAGIAKFEELVPMGSTFLNGFQHALEFLRRPAIDKTSELVKNIIQSNETKRVKSYIEAGCINTDDGRHNITKLQSCQLGLHDHICKGKGILNELECLLEDVSGAMQDKSLFQDDNLGERLNEQACINDKEEIASPCPRRNEVTDYAVLMAVIYRMVKQEYMMQERIVSALSLKSSSGELESYCLMWSLRPYIDEEIMGHAWKLIH
ncbi:uncharacterized protein LOC112186801 isoform X2 [Rosa chinensis]|uniref:uncharacterized protein LOC112186801 isoform X2 n=1 Tax=Rosa chinensis TaxID=74649 RepID=UPI000D0965D9|nr:uncharacterized protein LOC112186801 isoform X2 [Rosa chinensis]